MEKIELSYANNQALLNNFHPKIYCDSKSKKIHTIVKKKNQDRGKNMLSSIALFTTHNFFILV